MSLVPVTNIFFQTTFLITNTLSSVDKGVQSQRHTSVLIHKIKWSLVARRY